MTGKKGEAGAAPRTPAEWVSLVISLVLLAGVVGAVLALWLEGTDAPARFRVERGAVRYEAGHYHLPITVANEGDATGAQVTVEGKLAAGGREEAPATTFDFIPGRSSAAGVLIFSAEPTAAEVRVVSYQQP